jgi:glycosyltransferase involved in cell wall biosynthesis
VTRSFTVVHLTTADSSLRYLLEPQLLAVRDAGWTIIGVSAPGRDVAGLEADGIRHVALSASTRSMNPLADLQAARQLWRFLRAEQVDILHTHNPKPGLYGRVVGRLAGVPVVVNTCHGLYAAPDDGWPKRLVVYALEAIASRFSDMELVQNPEDLELMERWRLVRRGRARLLGNGVDLEQFDRSGLGEDVRASAREELGANDDDIVVGTIGRMVAEKGYPELFEAHRRLGPGYVLVTVGPEDPEKADALPPAMIDEARRAGVRVLGHRTDVGRLYAAMDIFVLPSHREGFPRAAMEAAAMGLPIVTNDVRGCRQVVTDGVNGVLTPVGDAAALAAAIRRLGDDGRLRVAMGEAGRERARREFDERQVVRIVMDTYRELIDRRSRRAAKA